MKEKVAEYVGMDKLSKMINKQLMKMVATGALFVSALNGREVWDLYLKSFQEEDDPIFRDPDSTTHNCNHCANFIRRYGNIIAIDKDLNIITLFDIKNTGEYQNSMDAMSKALKKASIENVFFETFAELNSLPYESCKKTNNVFRLGVNQNHKRYTKEEADKFGVVKANEIRTFNHMHLDLPKAFVNTSGKSQEAIQAKYRDKYSVFKRGMTEIPLGTYELVRDLIKQGSLLDGDSHLKPLQEMIDWKKKWEDINSENDNWYWLASYNMSERTAKFRNTLIGVMCSELAAGEELEKACLNWNKRVDPANYMKAVAPITQAQIDEAQKFVEENGYENSFNRRYAVMKDIRVSEILHSNVGEGEIKKISMFDNVKAGKTSSKKPDFSKVNTIGIEDFMKDVLPTCSTVELYLENKMAGNLVVMTTSDGEGKHPFKWDNNYSWTYNGNLAGKSQLADAVVNAGGRIDGAFRFTHSWNELEPNKSLMDLHVFMPGCEIPSSGGGPNVSGRRVGWNMRQDKLSGGVQDVDYTSQAPAGYVPVENITFPDINKMPEGVYTCKIHNWNFRKSGGRGRAEIAFGGEVYEYIYPKTKNHQWVTIAKVTLKDGKFTIKHFIEPEAGKTRELWAIDTNKFHMVNLVCLSPNHWGENEVGNKHYFFMLDGCHSDTPIRSFHNENLNAELLKHRKVMDVLGATNMLDPSEDQLAGVGFNATVRDEVLVKCTGSHNRMLKVQF